MNKYSAQAAERFAQLIFNESPTWVEVCEIRFLWSLGVAWKEIRSIYNVRDAKLLEIIKEQVASEAA